MQSNRLKRREFITLLGSAAAAWPLAAGAQQTAMPVVGFLHSASPNTIAKNIAAFREGLRSIGYVEGQNFAVEYRWAENHYDRLPALAADLIDRQVAVIVAAGAVDGPLTVKRATSKIPIVFMIGSDPIRNGLVASLNPRGGNLTGTTFYSNPLGPKRLELLHELVPKAKSVALLANPDNRNTKAESTDMGSAADALGLRFQVLKANHERDFEPLFAELSHEKIDALIISTDALFNSRIEELVALASRYAVPTVYFLREFVVAGGLLSYGASIVDMYRQAGIYVGRILNGASPADLPVLQPTKFQLVINLKTAKALGFEVPDRLLALADEVIE